MSRSPAWMTLGQAGPHGGPGPQDPRGGPGPQGPPGQFQPQYPQQFAQSAPGQAYAAPGWGNVYQPLPSQPAAAGVTVATSDSAKAAADANTADYAKHYQQSGQPQSQLQPQPQQANVCSAQPDYSAEWIAYYRSLGMFKEAEMIEKVSRSMQTQQVGQQIPQGAALTVQTPAAPVGAAAWAPTAYAPQPGQPAQVPYGQPNPYPGYEYARRQ